MLSYILISVQIIVLIILGILLWQVWYSFKRKDIPDDEPLGEERVQYLTRRLTWITICSGFVAALQIISAILRMVGII